MARSIAIGCCVLATTLAAAIGVAGARPIATEAQDAWGVTLRYAGEFGGFRIAAAAGADPDDRIVISYVTTGPAPDLLFLSQNGIAAPPPPCLAASPQVVQCPATGLISLVAVTGAGNDYIETSSANGPAISGMRIKIKTEAGNDTWLGGDLAETWEGGAGNDLGRGRGGRDRLLGGAGNDRMFGDLGIDFFLGGPGRDFARGGKGDDRGNGGPGDDNFKD